jgi:AcrR family transcriptional regulator
VSTSGQSAYHHGDLRSACLFAALELLEDGDETTLSLREVARRAGVSANAPYRHYADKDALLAALAVHGYELLREDLIAAAAKDTDGQVVEISLAYVHFALDHPAVFRLMFGHPCNRTRQDVKDAANATSAVLAEQIRGTAPKAEAEAFLLGVWAIVHGLATLILDGKVVSADKPRAMEAVVTDVVRTMTAPRRRR